jgi:hypothetical protein
MIMVAIVVVVVVIPVAIPMPPASFHVPPPVPMLPAVAARFAKFVPCMFCLFALVAVMLDGFMQSVVGLDDSFLAIICRGAWCCSKQRQASRQQSRSHD